MKKLFETEIVTHWMAAILKTDLYRKLEQTEQTEQMEQTEQSSNSIQFNSKNWACDALTQTRFLDDEKNRKKQKRRDLRHLATGQCNNMYLFKKQTFVWLCLVFIVYFPQPSSIFVKKFTPSCHGHVTLPREICTECFERLVSNILQGDKMLHFAYFICIFIWIP
jgi:F0F1-type ATP synthase membrane subunit a